MRGCAWSRRSCSRTGSRGLRDDGASTAISLMPPGEAGATWTGRAAAPMVAGRPPRVRDGLEEDFVAPDRAGAASRTPELRKYPIHPRFPLIRVLELSIIFWSILSRGTLGHSTSRPILPPLPIATGIAARTPDGAGLEAHGAPPLSRRSPHGPPTARSPWEASEGARAPAANGAHGPGLALGRPRPSSRRGGSGRGEGARKP